MASCSTPRWVSSSPYVTLTVTQQSQTGDSAVLAWNLKYISDYAAGTSSANTYRVVINGSTVKSSSYDINGKTGTHTIASGTVTVSKGTAAKNISFSVSFDWEITWSGNYCGTNSASGSISISAKSSYTVSYNANGGSGAPSSQTKWYNTALTLSGTKPTRTGYTFKGWATSSSGSVVYAAGASYTTNAAATLYAVWQANTYTVTFNANGGSGAPSNQTKTYGVNLTLSSTRPTRTNYNFLGWGTSASATTVSYAAGAVYSQNAAITLYAIWELAYTKPRITGLSAARCDSSGTSSDDGAYVRVSFGWQTDKTVSSIALAWSSTSGGSGSSTVSASGTSGSVSQVIGGGNISTEYSYTITVTVSDSGGSTTYTRTVSGKAYAIDFLGGGKGAAFGKAAETDDFLDVAWNERVRKDLTVEGKIYPVSGIYVHDKRDAVASPNMFGDRVFFVYFDQEVDGDWKTILHAKGWGGIYDAFQIAGPASIEDGRKLSWRCGGGDSFGAWKTILDGSMVKDYVVEQGTSGIWIWRKWSNGVAECWGKTNKTISCTQLWGSAMYLDSGGRTYADYPSGLFIDVPVCTYSAEAKSSSVIPMSAGDLGTKTRTPQLQFCRATSLANMAVTVFWHAMGKWK
ncbi:MAG: InlB B-repeat-containing protein [Lachnospiraceae bacterium]|nr:InlB B-repeat-containing protein [Lachnospiraceae bacterium]